MASSLAFYRRLVTLPLQGLLFAAIAFAWEKGMALSIVFSSVGVLSALSVGVLLRCGILAIKGLEESAAQCEDPVLGRGHKETPRLLHALLPWHFLPGLFMMAWFSMIVIRLWGLGRGG